MTRPSAVARRSATPWTAYACIVLAWLATRGVTIISIDLTPWMLHDLELYESWLAPLRAAAFPTGDPTWQYPPGAAPIFLTAGGLPWDFRWSYTALMLALDAAILAILMVAHARQRDRSLRGLWLWAVAGLIVGPIMLTRFDLVPTLFAVVSVLLVSRPALSGIAAAVGFVVKLWPGLMLFALPRPRSVRGLVAFAVSVIVMISAFALLFDHSLSFVENQQARGIQVESTGAVPYLVHSGISGGVRFGLEYGSVQVQMAGTEAIGLGMTLLGILLFLLIGWWRLSGRLESVSPGDVALTVMLVSVTTSRVNSPQYNTWLVGIACVTMLARDSRLTSVVWLVVAMSLITQIVYPWSATQLVNEGLFVIAIQVVRVVILLVATVIALRRIRPRRASIEVPSLGAMAT